LRANGFSAAEHERLIGGRRPVPAGRRTMPLA